MSNVQQDYSKFYQADAAALANTVGTFAARAEKLEKKDEKNKENLNKYSQETLVTGASGNQLEQKAVEDRVAELTATWEKSSNSEKKRIEAQIINIGTKVKAHQAKKLEYAGYETNGTLMGNKDYYGNETSSMIMQNQEGEGWQSSVTLDENNNFVYTSTDNTKSRNELEGGEYKGGELLGPRTVNSADWANSFTVDKGNSEKALSTLSGVLQGKGIKGLPFDATDRADLLAGLKNTVLSNPFELSKVLTSARFKNSNGDLVNFETAIKDEPNVVAALAGITDPKLIAKYDSGDKDGKRSLEDFEQGFKDASLQTMIQNITRPTDPVTGEKNKDYIGFEGSRQIVSSILSESLIKDKYAPAFDIYTEKKNEITNTQAVKNLNAQIGNIQNRLMRDVGSNNKSNGVNSLKNIKGAPGIRIDMSPSTGVLTQNYQVEKEGGGVMPETDQISPQDMLDIVFGAGNQNWPDWKTKPGFAATWKKWDDAWNVYVPTEEY